MVEGVTQRDPGVRPLDVKYDADRDVVTVDGMKFTGTYFRLLAEPDPSKLYRFTRIDEITSIQEVGEA
jgi:hypothetical protein